MLHDVFFSWFVMVFIQSIDQLLVYSTHLVIFSQDSYNEPIY